MRIKNKNNDFKKMSKTDAKFMLQHYTRITVLTIICHKLTYLWAKIS